MTNYRIDRIGTNTHASAPILTTSTRQQGQGYESIVSRYEYWANGNW